MVVPGLAVWLVPHRAAGCLIESFSAWADADERARAARFARDCDRAAYAISHAALRLVLGAATEQPPASVRYARRPGGKPVLAGEAPSAAFSLSHTRGATLIALTGRPSIGADIETTAALDAERTLGVVAGVEEAARLRAETPPGQLAAAVLRLWVIKEAALKLDGIGLALDPRRIVAEAGASGIITVRAVAGLANFAPSLVRVLDLGSGFAAAIALPVGCRSLDAQFRFGLGQGGSGAYGSPRAQPRDRR